MIILAETILWLFIVDQVVLWHFYKIEINRKSPSHFSFFIGLLVIAVLISIGTFSGWVVVLNMFYLGLVYNVTFNLKLNIYRKKPLLYLGEDNDPEEDSIIDQLERSMKSPGGTLGLKVTLIIMCIFSLINLI